MFIAALFTIAKIWKQPKCPSTDEWIKQLWYTYIYIIYIYFYIRNGDIYIYTHTLWNAIHHKNEIVLFGTTWMNLEDIMLK